jgi:hypothetical protein
MLEAGRCLQQAGDLVRAQHHRQLARIGHAEQLAGKVGAVEGMREEEPQRRDDAVHRWRGKARVALLDLEPAHVVGGRGVGRASQEGGKAPDVANVVALGGAREPPHVHVFDQPLAQRADRGNGRGGDRHHHPAPQLKEP